MEKKSLQFELWQECNQRCTYCYLGKENRHTPDNLKLDAMQKALDYISDENNIKEYNVISYIGGEFFQGQLNTPDIKATFFNLMKKTAELLALNKIDEIWLMCTLTIGKQEDLYTTLDIFKKELQKQNKLNLLSNIWLVTSYDTIGRFHSVKMENTWDMNMKNIHDKYPEIKFNICTILTEDLLQKYLNNIFSFNDFIKKYNCNFFLKQPSPGSVTINKNISPDSIEGQKLGKILMEKTLPGFFPLRKTFIRFLLKFKDDCPGLYDKLFNVKYRADDLFRNFNTNDNKKRMHHIHRNKNKLDGGVNGQEKTDKNKCGHLINFAAYLDSDECMICDREAIGA